MNKIDAAMTMIVEGFYEDAGQKLQNDVLQKADGCATGDKPDRNDWIISCDDQATFSALIVRAIELLDRLVQ